MMTQLDKNYNEYTYISSALEKVWLLEKMAREKWEQLFH